LCAFCLFPLGASIASAADLQPAEQPPAAKAGWVFQVTPYLWAAGIEGDISPFRATPTLHIEKSFSDILEDLNFGGFVHFWARKDRFVLLGDVMYVNTTESKVIGELPILGAVPGLSAEVDSTQFTSTLQAGYRLYGASQMTIDLLGGARFWYLANRVTVHFAGFSLSRKADFHWIDPVISACTFFKIFDKVSVLVYGDVGGFDVGSQFTWQVLATVNYSLNDNFAVSAGYKALAVDYASDGHVFDTTLSGPVLGLTYRFVVRSRRSATLKMPSSSLT
jgi:hypothetical protein